MSKRRVVGSPPIVDPFSDPVAWVGLTEKANDLLKEITCQTGRSAIDEVERALVLYRSFANLANEMTIQERSKNVAG
jgi:hypothetical protein